MKVTTPSPQKQKQPKTKQYHLNVKLEQYFLAITNSGPRNLLSINCNYCHSSIIMYLIVFK